MGLAVVLAMLGAACGKSQSPGASATQPTTSPSLITSPPVATSPPASPSSSPTPAGSVTLKQGSGGFVFTPSALTVKKGETITVSNVGTASHTFTINGKGINVINSPGQSQSVTIALAPGTYPFVCTFHAALGMMGVLTVTG